MLMAVLVRKRKQNMREEEARFELTMLVNTPAMYNQYIKRKEEDEQSGNANVEWRAPETRNEALELMKAFAEIDEQIKQQSTQEDADANNAFVDQVNYISDFSNININEMGD